MYVECKKHNSKMTEKVVNNKLAFYCLSCKSERKLTEATELYLRNEKYLVECRNLSYKMRRILRLIPNILLACWRHLFAFAGSLIASCFWGFVIHHILNSWFHVSYLVTVGLIICFMALVVYAILSDEWSKIDTQVPLYSYPMPTLEEQEAHVERQALRDQEYVKSFKEELYQLYKVHSSQINDLDQMTGIEFETFLKDFFERMGYKVKLTKASGDNGVDLFIFRSSSIIAVQCKRYSVNVGVTAVQEVFAGKGFYNCDLAWVVTNSYFTNPAKKLAEKLGVVLWDRNELVDKLSQVQEKDSFDDFLKQYYDMSNVNHVSIQDFNKNLHNRKALYPSDKSHYTGLVNDVISRSK
ncbi:restriction endonuclease [Paenibacillus sp. Soil787]|uniref:restriction endonuclease n=1 Tax=Paenibacillus sp. Soil787 TaxID=1736411 RepID=UPI0006F39526|nr:restriction endonuclease [Paenibacillus sp. Soil787]KRF31673.1 hypothetical protein ASG93_04865 [Paenibacillus sp. Soil787]